MSTCCEKLYGTCGAEEDVAIELDAHLTPTPRMRPGRSLPNTCPYVPFGSQKMQPRVGIRVDGAIVK
jgi:hypothetical protein